MPDLFSSLPSTFLSHDLVQDYNHAHFLAQSEDEFYSFTRSTRQIDVETKQYYHKTLSELSLSLNASTSFFFKVWVYLPISHHLLVDHTTTITRSEQGAVILLTCILFVESDYENLEPSRYFQSDTIRSLASTLLATTLASQLVQYTTIPTPQYWLDLLIHETQLEFASDSWFDTLQQCCLLDVRRYNVTIALFEHLMWKLHTQMPLRFLTLLCFTVVYVDESDWVPSLRRRTETNLFSTVENIEQYLPVANNYCTTLVRTPTHEIFWNDNDTKHRTYTLDFVTQNFVESNF